MTDAEKILAKCAFDDDELRETSYELGYHDGGREENNRLLPIIKLLLADRERLIEALKCKCMCYGERDIEQRPILASRNPCHACQVLAQSAQTNDEILGERE